MKFIRVEMPNGEKWHVPAELVARNRAEYYSKKEKEKTSQKKVFNEEYKLALSPEDKDYFELIDWAQNNMDWKDVKKYAMKEVDSEKLTEDEFEEGWINGEMEVVEVD